MQRALDRLLEPEERRRMHAHRWPGNVRELRAAVRRAIALDAPVELTAKPSSDWLGSVDLDVPFVDHRRAVLEAFEIDDVSPLEIQRLDSH